MATPNEWEGLALANERYVITAKLGEGGMGSVFRAFDRNIEADVVIKIPRPAMMEDPEFASRFAREIRSLVRLSHPHIVKVSDVGSWDGTPFAVMQFLAGGSLEDRRALAPGGQALPCDPKSVPRWLEAVAAALDYIHAQGYVHRDVKPGNILFDAEGYAFLSDFGVAKVLTESSAKAAGLTSMTGAGMVLGTPEYMAPELVMGEPFDGRVDQYALAVTVYELLCGRRPFEDETKTRVLVLQTTQMPPRLTAWAPGVPEPLSKAVLRGLSKNADERYANCAALAAAVVTAVEATTAGVERIRLQCPGCGKSGGMPVADYARLTEGGRRPTCPACKGPLDAASTGTRGSASSGTMRLTPAVGPETRNTAVRPVRGGTAAVSAPRASGEPSFTRDLASGSGTTAFSAQKSRELQPTNPEPRYIPTSRGSKTLVEPIASPPNPNAVGAEFQDQDGSRAENVDGRPILQAVQGHTVMIAGVSVSSFLLVLGLALVWPRPRQPISVTSSVSSLKVAPTAIDFSRPASDVPPPKASPAQLPATTSAESAPGQAAPRIAEPVIANQPASSPGSTDSYRPESGRRSSTSLKVPADSSVEENDSEGNAPLNVAAARLADRKPKEDRKPHTSATQATRVHLPSSLLAQRPKKVGYPLDKIRNNSRSYLGQIVVPAGMYSVAGPFVERTDGQRKLLLTQLQINERANDPVDMTSAVGIELEVEPNLGQRLDELGERNWNGKVAIIGVWFSSAGLVLVTIEMLDHYKTSFKKATYSPQGDIQYFTWAVTPEKTHRGMGNDTDWETPERMLHFANLYKRRVRAFNQKNKDRQLLQLQSTMNNMWGSMMQGAAAEAARQQTLQRAVGGR